MGLSRCSAERKKYRYEDPEMIYTFWAKHGPCSKPGCGHRTPVSRSPLIAEKVLGDTRREDFGKLPTDDIHEVTGRTATVFSPPIPATFSDGNLTP
jgi:putative DNA methylase